MMREASGSRPDPMTPTDIDRELGTLSRKMLSGSASSADRTRYQELLQQRSMKLTRLPSMPKRRTRERETNTYRDDFERVPA